MLKIINFTLSKNCSMAIIQKYVRTFSKLHGKLKGNILTILLRFSAKDIIKIHSLVHKKASEQQRKVQRCDEGHVHTQSHVNRMKI